jgi:hypothetical protein
MQASREVRSPKSLSPGCFQLYTYRIEAEPILAATVFFGGCFGEGLFAVIFDDDGGLLQCGPGSSSAANAPMYLIRSYVQLALY